MLKSKEITTGEIVVICEWYKKIRNDEEASKRIDTLPVKVLWALRKNILKISSIGDSYVEMRDKLVEKVQSDFFKNDEKSFDIVSDDDQPGRKIKDEYLAEYHEAIAGINNQIVEIANEKNTVEFDVIDIDAIIDDLAECELTMEDLDILSFMHDSQIENETSKEVEAVEAEVVEDAE